MKLNTKVSSSRRRSRKAHFTADDAKRRVIMSSNLSKELREQYKTKSYPIAIGDDVLVLSGDLKGKRAKVTKLDRKKYKVYLDISYIEKKNGQTAEYGIHSSNLQITKFAMGKIREAGLKKMVERKEAKESNKE